MRNAYNILVGKPEGKTPYGRRIRRWKDINKLDLKGVVCDDVDWIHLAQYKVQWRNSLNTVTNFWLPERAENF